MKTNLVSRYHPLLVTLHWLLARPDRRHVVHWFFLACADAQHRSPEDRHSADPYVRRNVDPRPDGRPLYCPNADVETGGCDDRQSPAGLSQERNN
jgi:hypothetical protein